MNTPYQLRNAEPHIQRLVNRIARMAGLDYRIEVYSSDAPLACSSSFKEQTDKTHKPIIQYNPVFLEQVCSVNPWATVAILAQEIVLHYNNNLYRSFIDSGSEKNYKAAKLEIRADKFTGWVLWHEGARLKEAMDLYKLPKFSDPYAASKRDSDREHSMRSGWIKAYTRVNNRRKPKKDPPADTDKTDDTQPDSNT